MAKKNSSNLNSIMVLTILREYSSPNHPLTIDELTTLINRDFSLYINETSQINRSTVTRLLNSLCNFEYNCEEHIKLLGFVIKDVMKVKNNFVPYENKNKNNPSHYYYYQSIFFDTELITLANCIETHPYFSSEDIIDICDKLKTIQPRFFSNNNTKNYNPESKIYDNSKNARISYEDSLLLMNISDILKAIQEKRKIKIQYGKYSLDKKVVIKNKEHPHSTVDPAYLLWSNGFCYMLAQTYFNRDTDQLTPYRVDRIMSIEITEKTSEFNKQLNIIEYLKQHPIMHTDKPELITLLCKDTPSYPLGNLLMDTFGKSFSSSKVSKKDMDKYHLSNEGGEWYQIKVTASCRGTKLWIKQYANTIIVKSPAHLAKEIIQDLSESLSHYSGK